MDEVLPEFPYHPDPVATGSVEASDATCRACGRARGFIYTGPVYAVDELHDALCPWCISDGSAAGKFDAEFTDVGADAPDDVPADVIETIARRTPGFEGWQQEHWLYHCGDGAAFLGPVEDGTAYRFRCRHCVPTSSTRTPTDCYCGAGFSTLSICARCSFPE